MKIRVFLQIFILILFTVSLASAQQAGLEETIFDEMRKAPRNSDRGAAVLSGGRLGASIDENHARPISPGDTRTDGQGRVEDEYTLESGERKTTLNHMPALQGSLLGANADDIKDYIGEHGEGPLAEFNLTSAQTDPGVADGLDKTHRQLSSTLTTLYLAELNYHNELGGMHPDIRENVLRTRSKCCLLYTSPSPRD